MLFLVRMSGEAVDNCTSLLDCDVGSLQQRQATGPKKPRYAAEAQSSKLLILLIFSDWRLEPSWSVMARGRRDAKAVALKQ